MAKYWQSFGEVNDPKTLKTVSGRVSGGITFEGFDDKGLIDAKAPAGIF